MERTRPCQWSVVQRPESLSSPLLFLLFMIVLLEKISNSAVKGQRPVQYFGAGAPQHRTVPGITHEELVAYWVPRISQSIYFSK